MSVFKSSEVKKSTGLLEWIYLLSNDFQNSLNAKFDGNTVSVETLSFRPELISRSRTGPDQSHSDQDQAEVRSRTIGN